MMMTGFDLLDIDTSDWFEVSVEFCKSKWRDGTLSEVYEWIEEDIKNICFGVCDNTVGDSEKNLKYRFRFNDESDALHFRLRWG